MSAPASSSQYPWLLPTAVFTFIGAFAGMAFAGVGEGEVENLPGPPKFQIVRWQDGTRKLSIRIVDGQVKEIRPLDFGPDNYRDLARQGLGN